MLNFDEEKAKKMREAEEEYDEWVNTCQEWVDFEEMNLTSKSSDSR